VPSIQRLRVLTFPAGREPNKAITDQIRQQLIVVLMAVAHAFGMGLGDDDPAHAIEQTTRKYALSRRRLELTGRPRGALPSKVAPRRPILGVRAGCGDTAFGLPLSNRGKWFAPGVPVSVRWRYALTLPVARNSSEMPQMSRRLERD
jgi:hypothetical protein